MSKVKHLKISHTSLNAWRKNPRKFYYEYQLSLRPKPNPSATPKPYGDSLAFGITMHRFCELYTMSANVEDIATQAISESSLPETGVKGKDHAKRLMLQYAAQHLPSDGPAELELLMPLSPRITYVGHIDKLTDRFDYTDPEKIIIDYKTTSKHLRFDWLPTLNPSAQAIGYILSAQAAGHKCESCLFRGISSDPKLLDPTYVPKSRKGEVKPLPPLFLDHIITPTQFQIDEWKQQTLKDCLRLIEDIESGVFTCCCGIGDFCSYRRICLTPPEDRDKIIQWDYDIQTFRGFSLEMETK